MHFAGLALLALSSVISAENIQSLVDQFSTIQSTDSAAFTSWRESFDEAYKTYIVSYYDHHGSEIGYGPSEVASIESSLLSEINKDSTQDYSFFYSEFYGTDGPEDYETGTDEYWTGTYETGAYETGETYALYITDTAELNSFFNATDPYAFYTSFVGRNGTHHHANHSAPITSASASETADSYGASSSYNSGSGAAASSGSYTPVATVSSYEIGARQAPMIVGAALAGLSVFFF